MYLRIIKNNEEAKRFWRGFPHYGLEYAGKLPDARTYREDFFTLPEVTSGPTAYSVGGESASQEAVVERTEFRRLRVRFECSAQLGNVPPGTEGFYWVQMTHLDYAIPIITGRSYLEVAKEIIRKRGAIHGRKGRALPSPKEVIDSID